MPSGEVQLLSDRRFDPNAAFGLLPITDPVLPSVASLSVGDPQTIWGSDYRGIETIAAIQTVDGTGWGLTIKRDASEALAVSSTIRGIVVIGSALAILGIFIGWLCVLLPLGRRIERTAVAAERVAHGDYEAKIGDASADELSLIHI